MCITFTPRRIFMPSSCAVKNCSKAGLLQRCLFLWQLWTSSCPGRCRNGTGKSRARILKLELQDRLGMRLASSMKCTAYEGRKTVRYRPLQANTAELCGPCLREGKRMYFPPSHISFLAFLSLYGNCSVPSTGLHHSGHGGTTDPEVGPQGWPWSLSKVIARLWPFRQSSADSAIPRPSPLPRAH